MFGHVLTYIKQPELLGRPSLDGAATLLPLNVPMICLNVIDEMRDKTGDSGAYESQAQWCLQEVLKHYDEERQVCCEELFLGRWLDLYAWPDIF